MGARGLCFQTSSLTWYKSVPMLRLVQTREPEMPDLKDNKPADQNCGNCHYCFVMGTNKNDLKNPYILGCRWGPPIPMMVGGDARTGQAFIKPIRTPVTDKVWCHQWRPRENDA